MKTGLTPTVNTQNGRFKTLKRFMRLNGKSPSVQRLQRLTQPSEDQREGKYCHAILPHHFSHISAWHD